MNCKIMVAMYSDWIIALKIGVALPKGNGLKFEPSGGEPVMSVVMNVVRRNPAIPNQDKANDTTL